MKASIDYTQCMGDRNCNKVCPEVFGYDEDRLQARVLTETVPAALEQKARQAADECPTKAIVIEG